MSINKLAKLSIIAEGKSKKAAFKEAKRVKKKAVALCKFFLL